MRKVILLLVLLSGFNAFVGCCANKQNKQEETDTNIERYLEMKAEVERLESELKQKDLLVN